MPDQTPLPELPAVELRDRLASGALSAVDLAKACIARIEAREPEIGAWVWFDASHALKEAERLDAVHKVSGPVGPLHGLPVGIKDVIDTAGIPTENGCPLDAGRVPEKDAVVVARLKAAGAVIFGKTVTTELAYLSPGKTRNPVNTSHTPGGSSSGSAAAVADGMIPLAVGTQTGGSVIRPASFCGITGFKPSFNAIPRDGVLMQSHSLDTLGVFARDPEGVGLIADVVMGNEESSQDGAGLLASLQADTASTASFAVVTPPGWNLADPALVSEFSAFCNALGDHAQAVTLPEVFHDVAAHRARINSAEMAHHFRRYVEADASRLAAETRDAIAEGMAMTAPAYLAALDTQAALSPALEDLFVQYDAILCPAALGPAPEGLSSTGDSIFNGLWTMAGTPAITLPLLTSPNGLPMGIQLVGPANGERRLMHCASWLWRWSMKQFSD